METYSQQSEKAQNIGTEGAEEFVPYPSDLRQIASTLSAQISGMLADNGVSNLTPQDPEWNDFKQVLDEVIPQGNGAAILRAAGRAGKSKAARLSKESEGITAYQMFRQAHVKPEPMTPTEVSTSEPLNTYQMWKQAHK